MDAGGGEPARRYRLVELHYRRRRACKRRSEPARLDARALRHAVDALAACGACVVGRGGAAGEAPAAAAKLGERRCRPHRVFALAARFSRSPARSRTLAGRREGGPCALELSGSRAGLGDRIAGRLRRGVGGEPQASGAHGLARDRLHRLSGRTADRGHALTAARRRTRAPERRHDPGDLSRGGRARRAYGSAGQAGGLIRCRRHRRRRCGRPRSRRAATPDREPRRRCRPAIRAAWPECVRPPRRAAWDCSSSPW